MSTDNNEIKDLAERLQDEINDDVEETLGVLTPMQRKFVDTYLFHLKHAGNFEKCAKLAGYKQSSIAGLKTNERINEAIRARGKFKLHNRTIDKAEAIANLRRLLSDARKDGNFPAYSKAVQMELEIAGLLGDVAGQTGKVVHNTQINLTQEARDKIAGNLSEITKNMVNE